MPSNGLASPETGAVEPDLVALLSAGLADHQAGRLAAAEARYRLVLERAPGQSNALYLYGVLRLASGQAEEAERLLRLAATARPDDPETSFAHANAVYRSGRREPAIQHYRELLARWPEHSGARINLSNALRDAGEAEAALAEAETAVSAAADRSRAAAETTRGAALLLLQRTEEAIAAYKAAIAADARHAAAHAGLAASLLVAERPAEALAAAESAALLAPELVEAEFLRAMALAGLKVMPAAIAGLRRTIARDPGHAKAHLNLGNLLAEEDRLDEAETCYRQAIGLDPKLVEAYASLGYLQTAQGKLPEAIASCEAALALDPEFVQAHWNEGIALLLAGDYARGWEKYEARKGYARFVRLYPDPEGPLWQGEALDGRTILVHAEQGLGDTIQFARYLPLLAARGASVVLACDAALVPLLSAQPPALMPGLVAVVARGAELPRYDCWVNQMSLPHRFATRLETIPAPAHYLAADKSRAGRFRERLPDGYKVGLAWAGNPLHSNDRRRSMPSAALARLLETDGATFVSLQVGPRAQDAAGLPGLIDLSLHINDFADTAALIATLDLVITVDTSVAHCAASLGKETWIMLAHAPDWRWLTGREDSPWYPSVRLFRQPEPGAWEAVVANVAALLRARTSAL